MGLSSREMNLDRRVVQMHFGGGTPTFLRAEEIQRLGEMIRGHFPFAEKMEAGVEIDPRRLTRDRVVALRLSRIVPSLGLFGSLYLIFYSLTPSKYRRKRYPKWPGVLLTTIWWIAVTTIMPAVLRNFFAYDLTYGGLAGVMIVLFFFWLVGLGVVIGAELNAAPAETPEEELSQTEETDEGRRAALAREMEEEEHAA